MPIDSEILPTFLAEAEGYLEALRRGVRFSVEISVLRQAAHGLKGAAAMLDLVRLAQRARELEEQLSQGRLEVLEEALEELESQLRHLREHGEEAPAPAGAADLVDPAGSSVLEEDWDPETAAMLRDLFVDEAAEHLEAITTSVLQLQYTPDEHRPPMEEMLRKAHTLKGSASTVGLPRISDAAHLLEDLLVKLKEEPQLTGETTARLHTAVEVLRGMVEGARTGDTTDDQLRRFRGCLEPGAAVGSSTERADQTEPEAKPLNRRMRDRHVGVTRRRDDVLRVRVDVHRLDQLMNAVGELVVQRTRIEQRLEELKGLARDMSISRRDMHAALVEVGTDLPQLSRVREVDIEVADAVSNLERAAANLEEDSEALRRTTHSLQDLLTQVRMMPIRWLHARLQRPMRELASRHGKLVELITDDESTEMDRLVFEQITDPLIHLIRNAVAHGIETPEVRTAAGKQAVGQIRVNARQKGDLVIVEVEDDGAGVAPRELREAMRQQGVAEEELGQLDDGALLEKIFASGFTTRRRADQLAGRGMGLSVVRQNIARMGGDIRVSSVPGRGTRFTIRMPVTTSIIQALLFKVGEPVYAIPVGYVLETQFVDPQTELRESADGAAEVRARERWIPLVQLHRVLGGDRPRPLQRASKGPARQPVITMIYGDIQFGITCRRVVGPREIVLKQLGPILAALPLFSGATVSGSSKVQFVLDVAVLAQFARSRRSGDLSPATGEEVRVLVVDDSRSIRAAVSHILHTRGYTVDVAADGWEAWERLQMRSYDVLITDLEMPRMHGFELIAKCRRTSGFESLPILVLTSRTAAESRELSLKKGATSFLPKPINRRVLLKWVRENSSPKE
jgi:chemosensory pili system protein ChpA (sensor histidine kinase/response regulator)